MNRTNALSNVNKFLIGSIIWFIFVMFPFYSETRFLQTSFAQHFGLNYNIMTIYAIQLVFFLVLSLNMVFHTVGKKHSVVNAKRLMQLIIAALLVVGVTQTVSIYFNIEFHFGIVRYLFGNHNAFLMDNYRFDELTFSIYIIAQVMLLTYITSMIVYVFQLKKMNMDLAFTHLLRLGVGFFLYAYTLGFAFELFSFMRLFLYSFYILAAIIIYVKTSYSLKAMLIGVFLLMVL